MPSEQEVKQLIDEIKKASVTDSANYGALMIGQRTSATTAKDFDNWYG